MDIAGSPDKLQQINVKVRRQYQATRKVLFLFSNLSSIDKVDYITFGSMPVGWYQLQMNLHCTFRNLSIMTGTIVNQSLAVLLNKRSAYLRPESYVLMWWLMLQEIKRMQKTFDILHEELQVRKFCHFCN
jgi:hypothetical protein